MTVYINEVQLYCSHEVCDQTVTLNLSEGVRLVEAVYPVIADQAFNIGWILQNFGGKAFCPNHDDAEEKWEK
jgi:hypothetical protein